MKKIYQKPELVSSSINAGIFGDYSGPVENSLNAGRFNVSRGFFKNLANALRDIFNFF